MTARRWRARRFYSNGRPRCASVSTQKPTCRGLSFDDRNRFAINFEHHKSTGLNRRRESMMRVLIGVLFGAFAASDSDMPARPQPDNAPPAFVIAAASTCGDGHLQPGEACEDGNQIAGDGCDAYCQPEVGTRRCGNGIVEADEGCDDGNLHNDDGCDADCTLQPWDHACGDGILDAGETCDDGNLRDGDGCSADCASERRRRRRRRRR